MKIGSLVVFIGGKATSRCTWVPTVDETYTIRDIKSCAPYGAYALLEEGVVGYAPTGEEFGIALGCLREIQPPEKGQEIVEEFNASQEPARKCFEMRE